MHSDNLPYNGNLPPGVSERDIEDAQGDSIERELAIDIELEPIADLLSNLWNVSVQIRDDHPDHADMLESIYQDIQNWVEDRADEALEGDDDERRT